MSVTAHPVVGHVLISINVELEDMLIQLIFEFARYKSEIGLY